MEKSEITNELEKQFQKVKEELGFKSSLEEIDEIFFIKDAVLKDGYVSDNFSRQLCGRISELYGNWANYLHNLLFPVPGHMLFGAEAKALSEEDRKIVWNITKGCMELASRNSVMGINKDKKAESKFIDDAVDFWNSEFRPKIGLIVQKINENWAKK